jgi:hypothetical protein
VVTPTVMDTTLLLEQAQRWRRRCPSLPPEGTPAVRDDTYITNGWYVGLALMFHHHSRMVRQSSVNRSIITASCCTNPVMISVSSPPDGALAQCRWLHHHRRMVGWPSVDVCIITARLYARPTLMVTSSPPDGKSA